MITPVEIILIGIVGIGVSVLGNIGGFGGGSILVPLLITAFYYDSEKVVGTVLFAMIIPAIVGTILAWRKDEVDWKFGLLIGIPSTAGAIAGAFITSILEDIVVVILVCSLAFIFCIRMIFYTIKNGRKKEEVIEENDSDSIQPVLSKISKIKPTMKIEHKGVIYEISMTLVFFLGVLLGIITGLLGISAGWLKTPILIVLFGLSPLVASGTSLFVISIKATAGGITHIFLGNIDWILFAVLAVTMPIGAIIGNFLKHKMKGKQISLIIVIALLLITIFTVVFFFI